MQSSDCALLHSRLRHDWTKTIQPEVKKRCVAHLVASMGWPELDLVSLCTPHELDAPFLSPHRAIWHPNSDFGYIALSYWTQSEYHHPRAVPNRQQ